MQNNTRISSDVPSATVAAFTPNRTFCGEVLQLRDRWITNRSHTMLWRTDSTMNTWQLLQWQKANPQWHN